MSVEIVCCEGWDPHTRSVVRPLPAATARERDADGEQYAIVLTGDRPLVVLEVCWAVGFVAAWRLDEQGRRDLCLELRRRPDGRLRPHAVRRWRYDSPDTPEFHAGEPAWRTPYWQVTHRPDGTRRVSSGNWPGPDPDVPDAERDTPAFGEWAPLAADLLGRPVTLRPAADPDPVEDPPLAAPWRPPVPLRPRHLEATFEPGARFELDGGTVTVEVTPGGDLALPTGRLVVADLDPWLTEAPLFTEDLAPGTYPVRLSAVRFADQPDQTRVAAVAVVVSGEPTVSWETAWRTGENELFLGDGEFFGVDVEGGRVALVDASAAAAHAGTVEDRHAELTGPVHEIPHPAGNLITVESGWGDGSYPLWAGRDEQGGLTCLVVDFLVLAHAKPG